MRAEKLFQLLLGAGEATGQAAGSAGASRSCPLLHYDRGAIVEDLVVVHSSADLSAGTVLVGTFLLWSLPSEVQQQWGGGIDGRLLLNQQTLLPRNANLGPILVLSNRVLALTQLVDTVTQQTTLNTCLLYTSDAADDLLTV